MKDGQTQKRATFNLTKSSGGFDNIKNASSIPKVTELTKYPGNNINTAHPLKLLIQKQQEDKKTGGGVIEKIPTNLRYYSF